MLRRAIPILLGLSFLAPRPSWAAWSEDGKKEELTLEEMRDYFRRRMDTAVTEELRRAIQREWDRFEKQVAEALAARPIPAPAASQSAPPSEAQGSGSAASALSRARSAEPPAVPPYSPVNAEATDQNRDELQRAWSNIQLLVNRFVLAPGLRSYVANYFWSIKRGRGGSHPDVLAHDEYINRQIDNPENAVLPTMTMGQLGPGVLGQFAIRSEAMSASDPGTFGEITLAVPAGQVIDHELQHFTDHADRGIGINGETAEVDAALARLTSGLAQEGGLRDAPGSYSAMESGPQVPPRLPPQLAKILAAETHAYRHMRPGGVDILPSAIAQLEQALRSQPLARY